MSSNLEKPGEKRSIRLLQCAVRNFTLGVALVALGDYAGNNIQVPIDNMPDAPTVSLKIRVKCAISDLLEDIKWQDEEDAPSIVPKEEDEPEEKSTPSSHPGPYNPFADEGRVSLG